MSAEVKGRIMKEDRTNRGNGVKNKIAHFQRMNHRPTHRRRQCTAKTQTNEPSTVFKLIDIFSDSASIAECSPSGLSTQASTPAKRLMSNG